MSADRESLYINYSTNRSFKAKAFAVFIAWMSWKQRSALSTVLKSERPFYHHHTMPTDLHALNDIVVRFNLHENT